ncbi:serine hydrolase domain-containing protein [Oceanicaulis sp. LC35]|uniref:serine hydrolase domain-containing protein n=1 Tax=Oceanicaulis sp. LC35 TaxID=3349635 RepID=UPI003F86E8D0
MQTFIAALGAAALITLPACAQSQTETAQAIFDQFAQGYPALNATVMVNGEIVFEAEGGTMRSERDGVDTDYNVYSTVKMMTGLAFARLEAHHGLDLDQSVRGIDPALPDSYQDVTLRQLLSHTAGVRNYTGDADWLAFSDRRCEVPADALGHFIHDPLIDAPGARHEYTTYGFVLLSHLLVELTGEDSFDAAMHATLGDVYLAHKDAVDADKATPYFDAGDGLEPMPLSAECKFGGGGLIASSRDLARFGAALAAGDLLSLEEIDAAFQPIQTNGGDVVSYVYGMEAGFEPSLNLHYAAHSGGSPGGRSFVMAYVEPQVVVATTGNAEGENHYPLALALADLFAGYAQ